jgi:hypothetical protein
MTARGKKRKRRAVRVVDGLPVDFVVSKPFKAEARQTLIDRVEAGEAVVFSETIALPEGEFLPELGEAWSEYKFVADLMRAHAARLEARTASAEERKFIADWARNAFKVKRRPKTKTSGKEWRIVENVLHLRGQGVPDTGEAGTYQRTATKFGVSVRTVSGLMRNYYPNGVFVVL